MSNDPAELRAALRGMLEHCSCQGRGWRSWCDFSVVKLCQSSTCRTARDLLGIEIPEYVMNAINRKYKSNDDG